MMMVLVRLMLVVVHKKMPTLRMVMIEGTMMTRLMAATLLLVVGQWLLVFYIDQALRTSPLGGGLGFLPVFMFWMYMMWLSILFGLEITMVAQALGDQRDEERASTERTP